MATTLRKGPEDMTNAESVQKRLAGPRIAEPPLLSSPSEAPKGSRRLRWALIASDIVSVVLAWVAVSLSSVPYHSSALWSRSRLGFLPAVVTITFAMIATNKLYRARQCSVRAVETAGLLRACMAAGVVAWLVAEKYQAYDLRIRMVVLGQFLAFLFIVTGRALYRAALRRARRLGLSVRDWIWRPTRC